MDGTLEIGGRLNTALVAWIKARRAEGFEINLWSAGGEGHARRVADGFGVLDLFAHVLTKPAYIVDDDGWAWTKHTNVIQGFGDV